MENIHFPEVYPASEAQQEHSSLLLSSLLSFKDRNYQDSTDVILVCQGEDELRAHRIILWAASSYFQENEHNIEDGRIIFDSFTKDDLEIVLEFMYTRKIRGEDQLKQNYDRLTEILEIAAQLNVDVLVKWCFHRLVQQVNLHNFQQVYGLAENNNNHAVMSIVLTFLAENFNQLVETEEFLNLREYQLKTIITHPSLYDVSLDDILKEIIRWVQADAQRRPMLPDKLSLLDLTRLSNDYLHQLLRSSFIQNNDHVLRILSIERTIRSNSRPTPITKMNRYATLVLFVKTEQSQGSWYYDVETAGTQHRRHDWSEGKHLPFNLEKGAVVVGFQNHVYVFGGGSLGNNPNPSITVTKYCPFSNTVSQQENSLRLPIHSAGAGILNDSIYVVNGVDAGNNVVTTVQCFTPRDGSCHEVTSTIRGHKAPYVASFNRCLYVVGSGDGLEKGVEFYEPLSKQWTVVTFIPSYIDCCHVAITKNQMFLLDKADYSHFHTYNLSTGQWGMQKSNLKFWGCPHSMYSMKKHGQELIFLVDTSFPNPLRSYNPPTQSWSSNMPSSYRETGIFTFRRSNFGIYIPWQPSIFAETLDDNSNEFFSCVV